MPRIQSPQQVLAIAGGAFLIGTIQAVLFGPVTLGPANITTGTQGVVGNPNRINTPNTANTSSPTGPSNPTETTNPTQSPEADPLLDAPVPDGTLTLRESYSLWEQGAYFVDARYEKDFDAGHIQYAAFLPAQLFDTDSQRAFGVIDSIPQDATVVLYCVGGECDASKNTAAMLEQFGYTDLRIMGAGYEHWVAAGFPTEVSKAAGGAP